MSHLEFIFWKYYFGHTSFYIRPHAPVDIIRVFFFFFNFRFSTKNSQSQQKLAKKMTHLTIHFRSKNLAHFTNLKSLDIEINMLPQHSQKPFWLYIFLFDLRKNICSTSFLDVQEPHSWSPLKANVCMFLYTSVTKLLFQRRSKILSAVGVGLWEAEKFP